MRAAIEDNSGSSTLEFALLAPVLLVVLLGSMATGTALWVRLGLQHGVEMAARCASINNTKCSSVAAIQSFAVEQTYGVDPPASAFTVAATSCGELVTATYSFTFISSSLGLPAVTLTARSCFPT